jgi:DNA-binding ferritin-like protein
MTKKNTVEAPGQEVFTNLHQMVDQQVTHFDALFDEVGRRQVQAVEQTNSAITEMTKMAQESMAFSNQLSQEWMKTLRGTSRWATDFLGSWAR